MWAKKRFTNYHTFCETYESIMVIQDEEPEILGILRGHSSAFWKAKPTFTFQIISLPQEVFQDYQKIDAPSSFATALILFLAYLSVYKLTH